jgi:hypothetical protein
LGRLYFNDACSGSRWAYHFRYLWSPFRSLSGLPTRKFPCWRCWSPRWQTSCWIMCLYSPLGGDCSGRR